MDAIHVHLLTNHIPILGSLFGFLLLITGMILKNKTLEITAVSIILIAALFTIPVFLSGEEAEHAVEQIQGASELHLEEHEEHAELSLWLMMVSGVLALFTLVSYKWAPHLTKITRLSTLVVTGIAFVSLIPLANHGGQIIHSELRTDGAAIELPMEEDDD